MQYSQNDKLEKVYAARNDTERSKAYDAWSGQYDRDVSSFGIQLPYVGATVFAHHVELPQPGLYQNKILDAGCGTGMHSLPLKLMGYRHFHGIDLSAGMLKIAKSRHIYDSLQQMTLGQKLYFKENEFDVTYSIGCLAPGNAPSTSLDEFLRVTKPGGLIIWSTHAHDDPQTQPYHDYRLALQARNLWRLEFETKPFISMPNGDANIQHAIYVYRVI